VYDSIVIYTWRAEDTSRTGVEASVQL